MAQWLRTLTCLLEDWASIPSTHIAAFNCLLLHFQGSRHPPRGKHAGKTPMYLIFKEKKQDRKEKRKSGPFIFVLIIHLVY